MQASPRFSRQPRSFWAYVKILSEHLGYSERKTGKLRRYSLREIVASLGVRGLSSESLIGPGNKPKPLGVLLVEYMNYRAEILETIVRPHLMDRARARAEFERLRKKLRPKCALPLNKQKREKRHHAFLVGIVNMLTEAALGGAHFDDQPRGLAVVTKQGRLIRTLSRWMDGAYPSVNNPKALWEIKEYYGTKTFGSRVADGVYETMLDGEELRELRDVEHVHVLHYLVVDDRFTWWECGRSYLCRIVDMLHMGLVDEVLFGREAIERWPKIVASWKK